MHVESVAWIAERKDVLSTFFFLLTIWAYARYVESVKCQVSEEKSEIRMSKSETNPKSEVRKELTDSSQYATRNTQHAARRYHLPSSIFYLLSLLLFALGLMGKPMLVTLPFVLLLLDYWPLRRMATTDHGPRTTDGGGGTDHGPRTTNYGLLTLVIEKLPFFALAAADCVLTVLAQSHTGAIASTVAVDPETRVLNAIISYGVYLRKAFWPGNMAVYYPLRENPSIGAVCVALVVLLVISAIAIRCIGHLDTATGAHDSDRAGQTSSTRENRHDRSRALRCARPYVAFGWFWFIGTLVPVIGLVQVGLQSMADRYTYIPYIGLFIAVTWAICDAVESQNVQGSKFEVQGSRFGLRFWSMVRGLVVRGPVVLWSRGPAILFPLGVIVLAMCALIASRQVRFWQTSETLWRQAVRVTSGNVIARQNLGSALVEQRRFAEGAEQFQEALNIKPMYAEAESNFGFALAMLGNTEEALVHYRRAVAMKAIGRTHYLIGSLLLAEGKRAEAIAEYKQAIELEPELPPALNDLAWILATAPEADLRDGNEAVNMAERACQASLSPNPQFIGTLAAAYAEAGRFLEAISAAERARELAGKQGREDLVRRNEELLQVYRSGKAYHETGKTNAEPLINANPR